MHIKILLKGNQQKEKQPPPEFKTKNSENCQFDIKQKYKEKC